jgi:hypothetical protein
MNELAVVPESEEEVSLEVQTDEEGQTYAVVAGNEVPIGDEPLHFYLVQPGKVKHDKRFKDLVGQFYCESGDTAFEEARLVFVGEVARGRNLFPEYDGGADEPLCKSYDGIEPAFNAETPMAPLCAECPKGDMMWKEGNPPECKEYRDLLFIHMDAKYPISIRLKGAGLSAWGKIRRDLKKIAKESKATAARDLLNLPKAGLSKKKVLDIDKCIIRLSSENEGTYYAPVFSLEEADDLNAEDFQPLIQYYGYKFITEAKRKRAAEAAKYADRSGIQHGNQSIAAPDTNVDLGDDDGDDEKDLDV